MNECSCHRRRRQKALDKLTKTEFWNIQHGASRLKLSTSRVSQNVGSSTTGRGWTTIAPATGSHQFLVRPWSESPQAMDAYGWTRIQPQEFISGGRACRRRSSEGLLLNQPVVRVSAKEASVPIRSYFLLMDPSRCCFSILLTAAKAGSACYGAETSQRRTGNSGARLQKVLGTSSHLSTTYRIYCRVRE
jgi:hypothetical protein